jgi:hypothetical protein
VVERRRPRLAAGVAVIRSAPPASMRAEQVPCSTSTWPWSSGWAAYSSSIGARVGDVEVAHGELADPVGRAEGGVARCAPSRACRVVGEVRPSVLQIV